MARTFKGGVHPKDYKHFSNEKTIERMVLPKKVIVHVSQHIGKPSQPIVKKGDLVKTGQKISESTGFVSIPMHSSVSGKVIDIGNYPHPTGTIQKAVVIESDGKDEWIDTIEGNQNYMELSVDEMKSKIADAGICGMGGAGFPTHVKLSPPKDKPIDTVILNGVECEPFLTADHRLMLEKTDEILSALEILMKILNAKHGYIGIEDNKPDAIEKMRNAVGDKFDVVSLKLKYPQGAEKQLIYACTKRKVPAGGLPMDVGVIVQNVGTALAVYEAVKFDKPLIERVTTITGSIVKEPKNLLARVGTPVSDMIEFCGGTTEEIGKLISGGPMMGFALADIETPTAKTSSGFVLFSEKEVNKNPEQTCIRCGRCVDACPMNLAPSLIVNNVQHKKYEQAKLFNIMDCIECGSCGYVCPANIQLVQWIKLGKLEIGKL